MIKQATLNLPTLPPSTTQFFFPGVFNTEGIIHAIQSLREGTPQNWTREFTGAGVKVEEISNADLQDEMKYLVVFDKKDVHRRRYMVLFPKRFDHDWMFEAVQNAVFDSSFEGHMPYHICSAGFMASGALWGHGRSETLNIDHQKEDKKNSDLAF